jgi:hypothetical protein
MSVEFDGVTTARIIAAARVAVGVVLVVAPKWSMRKWTGEFSDTAAGQMGARGVGGRDLAIGMGTIRALHTGRGAREWVRAGAIADALDAVAVVGAFGRLPKLRRMAYLASAAGATFLGIRIAEELD